ncbi:hypothetical protein MJO28_003606 [Puccinia striiformis f. sp. tritici]|uniref:Uncharacterized protein n=1 Tax=Puccinia striiformis f. sp. tritici TaxID=168172 RepID=A0ACC0EM80_9BASI|nr:hypothetical protein MJO28_003606 [Puccinia striiformis f. sp. tritici]
MGFDPADYLTKQGWSGPGNGFTRTGRSKPITVIKKKNTFEGVGNDRDTSHPWWDDLFKSISIKLDQPKQQQQQSNNNPGSALNIHAIELAKQKAGRVELYRRFLRGATIQGTLDKDDIKPPIDLVKTEHQKDDGLDSSHKKKRKRGKLTVADNLDTEDTHSSKKIDDACSSSHHLEEPVQSPSSSSSNVIDSPSDTHLINTEPDNLLKKKRKKDNDGGLDKKKKKKKEKSVDMITEPDDNIKKKRKKDDHGLEKKKKKKKKEESVDTSNNDLGQEIPAVPSKPTKTKKEKTDKKKKKKEKRNLE